MISAETVYVIDDNTTYDEFGEPTDSTPTETAVDVIVAVGSTSEFDASRPSGMEVVYTLHFPKTWTESLRGASVRVRGDMFEVVGDPQHYTTANTPGFYNRPVEVKRTDG